MSQDSALRQRARDAIHARELPNRPPDRLWGGPATGERCVVCGEPTSDHEFEFAYEGPDGTESHFAHSPCWRALEVEIQSSAGLNGVNHAAGPMPAPMAGDSLQPDGG
jgi:hypothetical protein